MAQGPVAALQPTAPASMSNISKVSSVSPTEDEMRQIRECERIVRFRDEVLSGSHPRIKVPAHLVSSALKNSSDSRNTHTDSNLTNSITTASMSPSAGLASGSQAMGNLQSFQANSQHPAINVSADGANLPGLGPFYSSSSDLAGVASIPKTAPKQFSPGAGQVQINPILLEKSDDLIKAEIQLQRQRLERSLREELDQHRAASKSSHATEALADFDLVDVLTKAVQLVQSTTAPQTDANLAANASGAESDSFDDNTFYTSTNNTPGSHQTSRIRTDSQDAPMRDTPSYEPPMNIDAIPTPSQPAVAHIPPFNVTRTHPSQPQQQQQSHYPQTPTSAPDHRAYASDNIYYGRDQHNIEGGGVKVGGVPMQTISSDDSGQASKSGDSGNRDSRQTSGHQRHELEPVTQQLLQQAFGQRNPMFRAHNLSPIAPQPSHVSPLATARHPPVHQPDTALVQGTPAQVAALRNDRSNGSSPDSSPQGTKSNKKGKKKKRKADRQVVNAPASPVIKAEPLSTPPPSAPQFVRPNKRARHSLRSVQSDTQALPYNDPRSEEIAQTSYSQSQLAPRAYGEERAPVTRDGDEYYFRQESRPIVISDPTRYEREYYEDRRPVETVQYVRRASPGSYPVQYAPTETRIVRSVSRAAFDRPYREAPVYYHDSREASRMSVRPGGDRDRSRSPVMHDARPPMSVMGPPRLPASRIVIDEFGREYIEPPRQPASVVRPSLTPASVRGEPEVVYERAPPSIRAASAVPGANSYDEGVLYRRPGSPVFPPRRVVTQQEYAYPPEYRSYRQREYSTHPVGQAGEEYVEVRGPPDRRHVEELPREYITRATTVRPVETVRYEMPREYSSRVASVRPEQIPSGEYAPTVHPDGRQFAPPPRAYSVRPMDPPPSQIVRREYSVRPVERDFYERPVREDDRAVYVDQDAVYGGQDAAPRVVYR